MDEQRLRDLFQATQVRSAASRAACPSPDALQECATSAGDDAARLAVLEHIATCAACRADFDLLRTAHAAAPIADVAAADTRIRAGGYRRWVAMLAAASLLIVGTLITSRRTAPDVMRGGRVTSSPITLHSLSDTPTSVRVVWAAVPQAVRYRVDVTLADGSVAFSTETADTVAAGSRAAGTIANVTVEAVRLDGTTVHSVLQFGQRGDTTR